VEKFIELCETVSPTQFVAVIVFLILGLKGASDVIKGIKSNLDNWYSKKRGIEKKDETLEQRVGKLEESDKIQLEKLDQIGAGVQQLAAQLEIMAEDQRKTTVSTARSTLYRLHHDFINKGYLTLAEREMFDDCASVYVSHGGNSVFKTHIIPEIESLPIRE